MVLSPVMPATGSALIVKLMGRRVALLQPVAGSIVSTYQVPAAVGIKDVVLVANGIPPVETLYQLACSPEPIVTINAGIAWPWQMLTLLPVGGGMLGQAQLGAAMLLMTVQSVFVLLVTVIVMFVPVGIPDMDDAPKVPTAGVVVTVVPPLAEKLTVYVEKSVEQSMVPMDKVGVGVTATLKEAVSLQILTLFTIKV